MSNPFIHIKSAKFPVLPGEEDELVNEGTYGKALAQYLEAKLKERGYDVPFICCEDWGWWLQIRGQPFTLGLCVYGGASLAETQELCFTISTEPGRRWSWTRFRFIDTKDRIEKLFSDLKLIVSEDPDIQVLGYPEDFPLG
jgi:hypothetical protein